MIIGSSVTSSFLFQIKVINSIGLVFIVIVVVSVLSLSSLSLYKIICTPVISILTDITFLESMAQSAVVEKQRRVYAKLQKKASVHSPGDRSGGSSIYDNLRPEELDDFEQRTKRLPKASEPKLHA